MSAGPDFAALAARLREVDDPEAEAVAEELEALVPAPRGRPADPPRERLLRRAKRVLVTEAVYTGTLPPNLVPEGERERVARAKGSRTLSDAAAGALIYAAAKTVASARLRRPRPMDQGAWEELKELAKLRAAGSG